MIEAALPKSRGKVAGPRGAAAKLGIPASTLESKIKQLGLRSADSRQRPDRRKSATVRASRRWPSA